MRLAGKIAVVVGAGQNPGEGIGNGRATVLRFAEEGARILAVDRDLTSAEETATLAVAKGGECVAFQADVTREATLATAMQEAVRRRGRLDILHNNVGVSVGGGDKPLDELSEEAYDRVSAINLRGTIMACKHAIPIMRRQGSGAIVNISSVAAWENTYPLVTYKVTKAGMVAFTQQLALQKRPLRYPRQLHSAGADGHADGGRHKGTGQQSQSGRSRRRGRRQGAAAWQNGHRLACGECGAVLGVRRGQLHYRRRVARGRRCIGKNRLIPVRHDPVGATCHTRTRRASWTRKVSSCFHPSVSSA